MNYKSRKCLLIVVIAVFLSTAGYKILSPYFSIGGKYDLYHDGKDFKANFEKKEMEIFALRDYVEGIVPENGVLRFGFYNRTDRFYLSITSYNKIIRNDKIIYQPMYDSVLSQSDLKLNSDEMNSILSTLNWSKKDIKILINKLKQANCIGIKSTGPFNKRPFIACYREGGYLGLAVYSYLLFEEPLTDSLVSIYNNKEGHVVYEDNVVFDYGYPL